MKTLFLIVVLIFFVGTLYTQEEEQKGLNLVEKRKNTFHITQDFILTFSVNYERLFPINEKINLGIRGGLGRDGGNKDNVAIAGAIFLYGKSKHFFEAGVAYQHPNLFESNSDDNPKLAIMAGYRYRAPKGFLLKVYPEFLPDIWPTEDSWGSLPFLGFTIGYSF